jgi:hypothetical protein
LIVGWSSIVVWLNLRPRIWRVPIGYIGKDPQYLTVYGCPWPWAYACRYSTSSEKDLFPDRLYFPSLGWRLAGNAAIGLLAVALLTVASKYLLRAIVAGLRALLSKPPPANKESSPEAR